MASRGGLIALLLLVGLGWGLSVPMMKIAVSTGYQHFGLLFWQGVIALIVMIVIAAIRGVWLPMGLAHIRVYAVIALLGVVLPNAATYKAIAYLPAGVTAILYSTVPLLTFPVALMLALERFSLRRLAGLLAGMTAVLVLVAPGAALPETSAVIWVGVMLLACLCYAFEGNYVARWGTAGLDAIQVLFGAKVIAVLLSLPLALFSGQWIDPGLPWGAPQLAHILGSSVSVLAYAGYVWLIGRAGPVFAVQVSYLVTIFGVLWSWLLLSEGLTAVVLGALALMCLGLYLVQPRNEAGLAAPARIGDSEPG